MLYQQPSDRPRLVVLIGENQDRWLLLGRITAAFRRLLNMTYFLLFCLSQGSLGARINELKQRVVAENPHRYGVAVPRERLFTNTALDVF